MQTFLHVWNRFLKLNLFSDIEHLSIVWSHFNNNSSWCQSQITEPALTINFIHEFKHSLLLFPVSLYAIHCVLVHQPQHQHHWATRIKTTSRIQNRYTHVVNLLNTTIESLHTVQIQVEILHGRNTIKRGLRRHLGPLIFRDRGKRTEFAESALWNGKRDFRKLDFFFFSWRQNYWNCILY